MSKKILWQLMALVLVLSLLVACAPKATPVVEEAAPEAAAEEVEEAEAPAEEAAPVEEAEEAAPAEEAEEAPAEEAAPAEEESAEPSVFTIAISTNIDTFDPHLTTSFAVANVVDYMVDTLINADIDGNMVPSLATDWEISDDGLALTFHLREGVKFSDGTPFNAEAVKYNIARFQQEELPNTKNPYDRIKEVVVEDDYTVIFKLESPSSELLLAMSNTNIAMVSPASMPEDSEAYAVGLTPQELSGTGPYLLKEYQVDNMVVVERNPDYWGDAPYYDEVVFQIVPEAATRESLLLAGQVDLAVNPPLTDIPALEANPEVEVLMGESARIIFIGLNTQSEYMSDPRVRQALNYAVDKEAIVQNVLLGTSVAVDSPMPSSFLGYCATEPSYEYNPEKAKELLEAAGVPEGYEFKFIAPTGRYVQDFQVAEAISGYLAEVGITAVPQTADWGTYMGWVLVAPEESQRDMYFLGWAGGYPHGAHTMNLVQAGAFFNRGYYENAEVEELIGKADTALTTDETADYYCQANQIIWEDAPWIFLYQQGYPVAYAADVTGVLVLPSEKFDAFGAMPVE